MRRPSVAELIQESGRPFHRRVAATAALADRPLSNLRQLAQRVVDDLHDLAWRAGALAAARQGFAERAC